MPQDKIAYPMENANPSPALPTCWMYLIRHGATANNDARPVRLQGRRTDPGLSDQGRDQAERTGAFFAQSDVDAVYSSPLRRARETAGAIATPHEVAVEIVEGLVEVDVGDWEGRPWDEVERANPEAYRLFMSDASVHPYLGGETITTVRDRSLPVIQRLMAENTGRTIVAVAHNVVNRTCLAHWLGMPLKQYRSIPQDNCGINLLRYRGGKVKLVTLNAVEHLREEGTAS
jgi:broad specificity phosphatase PhoE